MPALDLRSALSILAARGDLVHVAREVDRRFEVTAVLRRLQNADNRAVIFEHVRGSRLRVASNLFGSYSRISALLDLPPAAIARTWATHEEQLAKWSDSTVEAPDRDYITVALADLPILTHCEKDGGPYITAGVILAQDPASGIPNLSYHRMQLQGPNRLGLRITPGNHLGVYQAMAEEAGEALPVAILIGAPSAVMLAAAARLPLYTSELRLAAALQGQAISMQPCRTTPLSFPVGTEVVLDAEILPGVREPEGPFGDFMDEYIPVGPNHVLHVHAAYMRPDALYYGLLAGSVEQGLLMGVPTAAAIYRAVQRVVPSVSDVTMGAFAYHYVVKMHEEFDGQAKQALLAALGAEPSYVKTCTVVDEDVNIYDPADVAWAVATRCRPDRDIVVIPGVPSFRRDPEALHWGRLAIDATQPFGAGDRFERRRIPGEAGIRLTDYLAG
jgi:UbiD family decarboxylase